MVYQSVNPNNGKVLKSFDKLTDEQLEKSIAAAETCFQTWKHTSYAQRAEIVAKAATLMRTNVDKFARLATLEMGKRIDEARGEVKFSADILAYYAEHAKVFLAPTKLNPKVGEAHMENSPFGVLFCVEPWNFPYYQLARVAGPQLMAGNVLVVKHAGCVPQCAIAFEKLLLDAGAPKGAYTNLLISHEQSERIIDDPRIKGVALTGSVEAGRSIAARAGQNLKKTSMELGGSDAFIVLDDADLEKTVPWAVWGRMYNAGQTCCAAKRFIVLDSIADKFLAKFKSALSELKAGDPMDEKTTHGPLSTEAALVQLLKQVDDAVAHGATLVMGGKRIDRPGSFMETTILTDIKPDNPAFRDEFFGPVVSFFRVKDEAAAIALANDSDFGLGGSVFTEDVARGKRVASGVDTGMMFINNIDWSDAELPFGGIKDSGYGRELGNMGIQEFVNTKLVRTAHLDAPA
ncbi:MULTISPECIES: NAD-dependent succinate-semialdehyde dehydrogenase [Paraburkholderia]|jgi:succinate-semialdehyde dehydrogenase / glutarate-semialdehyde dehydrogenase|uniref:Succinate-semialdehyde dehydrogenase / glutarate-semialdehyde dehydrogenase n=1 Tax=Paraburkholderia phenazinium TaxID=60549 RepID=A0A1N6JQ57_9BURK|nr:NAD-dependent succinate-semialdehyde dehydrogenase [Paraburkholderia phenazinium]SIO46478.1 succinate-semialdehyde dehydrogenase / glutarate-semialdehyde dehydrogenase [Paraburkholderia phenazinium]